MGHTEHHEVHLEPGDPALQEVNTTLMVVGGVVGAALVVLTTLALAHYAISGSQAERQKKNRMAAEERSAPIVAKKARWETELDGPAAWVDEAAGVVRVPFSVAAEKVAQHYTETD